MSETINAIRPTVFNDVVNKRTPSVKVNEIRYEHGNLPQENRIFVENTINDVKNSKVRMGYDGTPIIKEVIEFEKEYPSLSWKDPDLLYDRMMNDIRNVIPKNRDLKLLVNAYYNESIRINLNNIYFHAPRFFIDNFVPTDGVVNNAAFELYQVYIYLLCFINYVDKHRDEVEIREMDNIDIILDWVSTRRYKSIEYIISGPVTNSDLSNTDFRSHYKTLISPSNDMSEMIQYNQLSTSQIISADVYNLLHFLQNAPNVYFKTPDEARKYNITIDSSKNVTVSIDNNNNLIFNCNYVNLGDTTEQNKLATYSNLDTVITNNVVNSMINTKKLAEIFHNYSRIKIKNLIITTDTFVSSLDSFKKVFVIFKGITCSERNIYNNVENNYLKIGGYFTKTDRGYEFNQDVDVITYKSVLADVKSFEIYLSLNPSEYNQIIPNEYTLSFTKDDVYQHPIHTNMVFDISYRRILKDFSPKNSLTHSVYLYNEGTTNTSINKITTANKNDMLNELDKSIINATDNVQLANNINVCNNMINKLYEIIDILDPINNFIGTFSNLLRNINSSLSEPKIETRDVLNLLSTPDFDKQLIINIFDMIMQNIMPEWSNYDVKNISKTVIENEFNNIPYDNEQYELNVNAFISQYNENTSTINRVNEYYITILNSIEFEVTQFNELLSILQIYSKVYSIFAKLIRNRRDETLLNVFDNKTYSNINVDTDTGTINGKYFRLTSSGDITFLDENRNEFTTPDVNFMFYNENENDLDLFNFYKLIEKNLYNIIEGTFVLSSNLSTIQNLPYILTDYTKRKVFRFDNVYNVIFTNGNSDTLLNVYPNLYYSDNNVKWDNLEESIIKILGSDLETYIMENYTFYKIVDNTGIDEGKDPVTTYMRINKANNLCEKSNDSNSDIATYIEGVISNENILGYTTGNLTYYRFIKGIDQINLYYNYHDQSSSLEYKDSSTKWTIQYPEHDKEVTTNIANIVNTGPGINKYVMVGDGCMATSNDLNSWKIIADKSILEKRWTGIAYGNNEYLLIGIPFGITGNSINAAASSDLLSWNINENYDTFIDVCYGNNIFVLVSFNESDDGFIMTYSNGSYSEQIREITDCQHVCYGNNYFVAAGNFQLYTSTNGTSWYTAQSTSGNISTLFYGNDTYIAFCSDNKIYSSRSETVQNTWTEHECEFADGTWKKGCYGNGLCIVVGNGVIKSIDGLTWERIDNEELNKRQWNAICYGNEKYVIVNNDSAAVSTDGSDWNIVSFNGGTSICFGNNLFVCSNYTYGVLWSEDGYTWSDNFLNRNEYSSVCYGNNNFIAPTYNKIVMSTDGNNWTDFNTEISTNSVAYINGLFINCGNNGLSTSINGKIWTTRMEGMYYEVCYGNGLYVALGQNGNVTTSIDGISWEIVGEDNELRKHHWLSISFGMEELIPGGIFILCGNQIFATGSDINNMTIHTMDARYNCSKVCCGKKTAMMFGMLNITSYDAFIATIISDDLTWYFKEPEVIYGGDAKLSLNYIDGKYFYANFGHFYEIDEETLSQYHGTIPFTPIYEKGFLFWRAVCHGYNPSKMIIDNPNDFYKPNIEYMKCRFERDNSNIVENIIVTYVINHGPASPEYSDTNDKDKLFEAIGYMYKDSTVSNDINSNVNYKFIRFTAGEIGIHSYNGMTGYIYTVEMLNSESCIKTSSKYINITDDFGNVTILARDEANNYSVEFNHALITSLDDLLDDDVVESKVMQSTNETIEITYSFNPDTNILKISNENTNTHSVNYLNIYLNTGLIMNESNEVLVHPIFDNDGNVTSEILINNKVGTTFEYDINVNVNKSNKYKAFIINHSEIYNKYWSKTIYVSSLMKTIIPIESKYSELIFPETANIALNAENNIRTRSISGNIALNAENNIRTRSISGNIILNNINSLKIVNNKTRLTPLENQNENSTTKTNIKIKSKAKASSNVNDDSMLTFNENNSIIINTLLMDVYTYDIYGVVHTIHNTVIITDNDILSYDNITLTKLKYDSVIVNNVYRDFYYSNTTLDIGGGLGERSLLIYDINGNETFKVVFDRDDKGIVLGVTLFKHTKLLNYDNIENKYEWNSDYLYEAKYSSIVTSDEPIILGSYRMIITYANKTVTNVVICTVTYDIKEYKRVINDDNSTKVYVRTLNTFKYSNIPGVYPQNSKQNLLSINISDTKCYKSFSMFKYFEKNLVTPKYLNSNNQYMTIVKKVNNTITENVTIKSQNVSIYNTENEYRIGNKIPPTSNYTIERLNSNFIEIGNMNKFDLIDDIAIKSNNIYVTPTQTKMLISIEFS